MTQRSDGDAGLPMVPVLGFHHRTFDNYHDAKHLLPTNTVNFSVECVCCRNRRETGEAHPLIPSYRNPSVATGPLNVADKASHNMHMPLILLCGHIAGWSCLEGERTGRCPACGVIWRRGNAGGGSANHCHHPIGINPFRSAIDMTDDEAEWLIMPGGYVPERCRQCITHEVLRELTRLARNPVAGDATRCVYATDGVLSGFLEGDELKPFATLDITVNPSLIPLGLLDEARRREEAIRKQFERTPPAETKMVGAGRGMGFGLRVAGLARPPEEQASGR